ncbi:unnamed protein product [Lactuca virosa]|uniref:Protein LNK1 n=1 Tax=Lactuca virosa TaxID=75947 RepID=A0AAU9MJ83_9ASTR|nr:unnamed protein product [Lactuca virosa]
MSDLSMYELEDIIWDDFDQGDDHIVPDPTNARTSRNSFEGDIFKKPRREATSVLSNFGNLDASTTICQKKSERDTKLLDKKKNMMEKESSFNTSCDVEIVKDTSDDTRMSDKCFKNCYVTSAAGDDNSYSYPLTHISQPEDLYNCEDKESGDLLYYGWSDIGNFEDVDNMLRNCDSSFGLNNNEELGWFASDQIGSDTEEALKMDFKFPCPEPSALNNASNKSHVMESCGDISFEGNATGVDEQKQGFQPLFVGSPIQMNTMFQSSNSVLGCAEKQAHLSKKELGSENGVGVHQKGISLEMGSLNVPEISSISSELDEISLEATSFHQLQQVMEQLDLRTKLCIRDSLYRLARSAEQRHNNPSLSSSATDINDSNNGLMDMETDTNPIDRSVAHLLFHRPSESPNLKHGSMNGEKAVCEEGEANDK